MGTPRGMKKRRIAEDALAQRSFLSCAKELAKETGPGVRRNHTMSPIAEAVVLRWSTQRRIVVEAHLCRSISPETEGRTPR